LMASNAGYGFRVQLKELYSKNKAGKSVLSVPEHAKVLAPVFIAQDDDRLAVATAQGRLLIFPVQDLPELAKGKGNKLMQIPGADLASGKDAVVAVVAFQAGAELKIISGKRFIALKANDIEQYSGNRANRGTLLPRGFQKVDGIECV
jgi:topoisomerase IV subunit A